MPQPVKISDALLLDARIAGETMNRSIAGQVEFWAQLGRSVERLLNGKEINRLRSAAPPPSLSDILASVDQPSGRARLQAVLEAKPYPHYRPVPGDPDRMERIEEDGTRTIGQFRNREFVATEENQKMKDLSAVLSQRPILITLVGPNGAGKSTFYESFLDQLNLQFINADILARELGLDAYMAARVATSLREDLVRQKVSFIFETVFSDPAGDKLSFLKDAAAAGFTVVLLYIGIRNAEKSEKRVAQRVTEGGHDVPADKLASRFPRILLNLRNAIRELPLVLVYDNDDLNNPYHLVATFESGQATELATDVPAWLRDILP